MELDQALDLVAEADDRERSGRAIRLLEVADLLGEGMVGFSGQAAEWLFEDVKATWVSGYFTSTVLTAYAFCIPVLQGCRFRDLQPNKRLAHLGVTINFVGLDQNDREWYFDVSGAFTSRRAGLIRTDTVWKSLGRASVLHQAGVERWCS